MSTMNIIANTGMSLDDAEKLHRLQTSYESDPRDLKLAYDLFRVSSL